MEDAAGRGTLRSWARVRVVRSSARMEARNLELRLLDLRAERIAGRLGDLPSPQEILIQLEQAGDAVEISPAEAKRFLRGDDVHVRGVEVVDLEPDGILELRLGDPAGLLGDERTCPPLVANVERESDVHIVLGRAAGAIPSVFAVGDELRVCVEDRVGPQARGQDVGLGEGDLEPQGDQVQVLAEQGLDRINPA